MLLPLRLNLLPANEIRDGREFLTLARRKGFQASRRDGPPETVWHHPVIPKPPAPLGPEIVCSYEELVARAQTRSQHFSEDDQTMALLLLAA